MFSIINVIINAFPPNFHAIGFNWMHFFEMFWVYTPKLMDSLLMHNFSNLQYSFCQPHHRDIPPVPVWGQRLKPTCLPSSIKFLHLGILQVRCSLDLTQYFAPEFPVTNNASDISMISIYLYIYMYIEIYSNYTKATALVETRTSTILHQYLDLNPSYIFTEFIKIYKL